MHATPSTTPPAARLLPMGQAVALVGPGGNLLQIFPVSGKTPLRDRVMRYCAAQGIRAQNVEKMSPHPDLTWVR